MNSKLYALINKNIPLLLTIWIILPLLSEIPYWTQTLCVYILLSTFLKKNYNKNILPSILKKSITVLSLIMTLVHYRTLLSYEPAITYITLLTCLKLNESETVRDYKIHCYLLLILILGISITFQNLSILAHIVVSFIFITSFLYEYSKGKKTVFNFKSSFKEILKLQLYVLPLIFLIFLLFPRYGGKIIFIPRIQNINQTGFTDTLSPGSVQKLLEDDSPVFRVVFKKDNKPIKIQNKDLYFRGTTLSFTNGNVWKQSSNDTTQAKYHYRTNNMIKTIQEITLEPKRSKYLFALDVPQEISNLSDRMRVKNLRNQSFRTNRSITGRIKYKAISSLFSSKKMPLSERELKSHLLTPKRFLRGEFAKWIKSITEKSRTDIEFIENILNYFKKNMRYTLSPGAYNKAESNDFLNTFLFKKKVGFCEHYASAFALIMRYAGVPSRIVAGYLGGEYNSYGNFYLIREKNAHVWVELYLNNHWVRYDPTSILYPLRIETGLNQRVKKHFWQNNLIYKEYLKLSIFMGGMENSWHQFLLNYDFDYQKKILKKWLNLNVSFIQLTGSLITFLSAVVLLFFLFRYVRNLDLQKKDDTEELLKQYQKLLKKLKRKGYEKYNHEGPAVYLKRLNSVTPEFSKSLKPIIESFINLRYKKNVISKSKINEFKNLLSTLD